MSNATATRYYWSGRTYLCAECAEEARADGQRTEEATKASMVEMRSFGLNCDWCAR